MSGFPALPKEIQKPLDLLGILSCQTGLQSGAKQSARKRGNLLRISNPSDKVRTDGRHSSPRAIIDQRGDDAAEAQPRNPANRRGRTCRPLPIRVP